MGTPKDMGFRAFHVQLDKLGQKNVLHRSRSCQSGAS